MKYSKKEMEWFSNTFAKEFDSKERHAKDKTSPYYELAWLSTELKNFPKKSKILDLMCGAGRWSTLLYKKGYHNIAGLDFSKNMLTLARKKNKKIKYIQADATKLPYKNNTFDLTISLGNSIGVIPGRNNRVKALKEAKRTLKPNGVLLYSLHNRWALHK
ncbi:MAG: methyltransferase domain-containing protein, partial [Candidatus Diapherotrites archaeon]|nr:methyltransferase domain-containing protein [Candidatus Diapherotrites archaeon]